MRDIAPKLEILYEDHHIVAVAKPARVPVASEDSGDETLLAMVRSWNSSRQKDGKKGYAVPIHFLDRPVSGVILFAISSKAASRLNAMFRDREMNKTYIAMTSKPPNPKEGSLEHWLVKDKDDNRAIVSSSKNPNAKKCLLHYRTLKIESGHALLEVKPVTGRSHQIRAQMSAIGCPLVGDLKYGAKIAWENRVALHAARLEFDHPVGGRTMKIMAPIPDYWCEIWSSDFPEGHDILFPRGHKK